MEDATYIPFDRYEELVEKLASLKPDPLFWRITPDQVKLLLAEAGGIWPDSIAGEDHDAVRSSAVTIVP